MRVFLVLLLVLSGCKNTQTIDEPLYGEQWALHYDKGFYEAYGIDADAHIHAETTLSHYTGKGIKIAVIDMGIERNHPEIQHSLRKVINSRDRSDEILCDDFSLCYHGTAIVGVIASGINNEGLRGIAPDAQIVFIHIDLAGYVGEDEILDALKIAEEENVDIINASWGTGDVSPIVENKINQMAIEGRNGKGTLFVFASGNNDKEQTNDESMLESVIGVGSTDEENLRAYYSNFGEGLDIVASGGYLLGITTTYPYLSDTTHTSPYIKAEEEESFRGTSASTPLVTGALALMLEAYPNATRTQITQALHQSSDKIGNVEYIDGKNLYYGYGKLNVDKAIDKLKSTLKQ